MNRGNQQAGKPGDIARKPREDELEGPPGIPRKRRKTGVVKNDGD